jgi:hypothetical protein
MSNTQEKEAKVKIAKRLRTFHAGTLTSSQRLILQTIHP